MADIDSRWYDLRNLVHAGDFDAAKSLIDADPAVLDFRNGIGETVLHFLAVENDLRGVAWLHSQGADLNAKNEFGTPVIFEVAQLDYQALYEWLVANGADTNARDANEHTIAQHLREFKDGLDS